MLPPKILYKGKDTGTIKTFSSAMVQERQDISPLFYCIFSPFGLACLSSVIFKNEVTHEPPF